LLSSSRDGTIRRWEVATGESVVWDDCGVHVWQDDLPRDMAGLKAWLEAATDAPHFR
jgi:hypothetical protein